MRFKVDWSLCDGNGLCAMEVPELLQLNDDDELVILQESFTEAYRAQAEKATQVCPKCALSIEED